jgi:uncharacterized membrane protein YagU involved in acid resistance
MRIRTAILAGIAGAVLIDLYLSISLPMLHLGTPLTLSQWDASNALGVDAFRGGISTAAIGFAMHLCVSIAWGIAFAFAAARIAWIRAHVLPAGVLFGIFVMAFMAFLVVPLGHASHPVPSPVGLLNNLVAHTAFFGIPVAWIVANNKMS